MRFGKVLLALAAGASFCVPVHAGKFTLFIYESPSELAARQSPEHGRAYWGAWGTYMKQMQDAGVIRGGMPLQVEPVPAATAESKLGGFVMIEVPTPDEARQWAAKAPRGARVDVRAEFPAPPAP